MSANFELRRDVIDESPPEPMLETNRIITQWPVRADADTGFF